MRETAHGLANSLLASKEVKAPLVVVKKVDKNEVKYVGFVPGLLMQDIENKDMEVVKEKLTESAKSFISKMLKEDTPFPFFPSKDEIMVDYPDTVFIKYIKIK